VQEFADECPAKCMAHVAQALAELAKALWKSTASGDCGSPRVSGLDQRAQIIEQIRVRLAQRPTTAGHPAYPFQVRRLALHAIRPARVRSCCARYRWHASPQLIPPCPADVASAAAKTPPTALVEHRSEGLEALAYGRFVDHAKTI